MSRSDACIRPRPEQHYWTVPQLARRWCVGEDKIRCWIHTGQLTAINMAANATVRPRFAIRPEDATVFENRRLIKPDAPTVRRHRRIDPGTIQFF